MGRHVFSTAIFGLLLDLEGRRAKDLQVRHTLSSSYSALVGQLFQPKLARNFQKIQTRVLFPRGPPNPTFARANAKLFGGINIKPSDK